MTKQKLNYTGNFGGGISINNTSSLKKYIGKESYANILYVLIKKEWTYFSEIKRMFGITTNIQLPNLAKSGLVEQDYPTEQEKDFVLTLYKNTNNDFMKRQSIYRLTEEAKKILLDPSTYDTIKRFAVDGIDNFIIMQKEQYEANKREQNHQRQQEKIQEILQMRKMDIEIPLDDKLWYEKILGRKI